MTMLTTYKRDAVKVHLLRRQSPLSWRTLCGLQASSNRWTLGTIWFEQQPTCPQCRTVAEHEAAPAPTRPLAGEAMLLQSAHDDGMHSQQFPREFCPECKHQGWA